MFELRYLPGVVTLTLDAARCDGCRMCVTVCPHAVFVIEHKRSRIVDGDACMECGACARNCPAGAITVRPGVGCATAIILAGLHRIKPAAPCASRSDACDGQPRQPPPVCRIRRQQ